MSTQQQQQQQQPQVGGYFTVVIHGPIVAAECPDEKVLYCRSRLVRGKEWNVVTSGAERANTIDVITQQAEKQPGASARFTWNTPFEVVLQSTNPFGWPQLALGLGCVTPSGEDQIKAYSRCHVPMQSGNYTLDLPLLAPQYSEPKHHIFGAFKTPEFRDFTFLCSTTDDRVVMTAKPVPGYVRVSFNVMISGLDELGYSM